MSERTQVNLGIDSARKERWHEYADKHYSSLSHLIRRAVENEVQESETHSAEISNEQMADLNTQLDEVSSKLDRISDRLTDLENAVTQDSSAIQELANDVFDILPTETEVIAETHEPVIPTKNPSEIGTVETGRLDHIATRLGVEEPRIGEALQKLQADTTLIGTKSIGGQKRYYKEV